MFTFEHTCVFAMLVCCMEAVCDRQSSYYRGGLVDERTSFSALLRHERVLRGWSQSYLASQLGCSTKAVNRWEKGQLPGKEYQRLLCKLFEKNAEEFGLL